MPMWSQIMASQRLGGVRWGFRFLKTKAISLLIYNLTFELYLERQDECNALASVVSYVL